jgi:hypothetical protein
MKAIVYTSNSGYTKHYAELLSAETGLPVYDLRDAGGKLAKGEEILYLGWLMAGGIKGYKKAAARYSVKAVCAVGMALPSEKYAAETREKNRVTAPFFYLQGGFDMEKLHGLYLFMMKNMQKIMKKKLEAKPDKTADEIEALDFMSNGGDRVRLENLAPVLDWMRGQR